MIKTTTHPRVVDNVEINVADLNQAIAWYQQVLGFTLLLGLFERMQSNRMPLAAPQHATNAP